MSEAEKSIRTSINLLDQRHYEINPSLNAIKLSGIIYDQKEGYKNWWSENMNEASAYYLNQYFDIDLNLDQPYFIRQNDILVSKMNKKFHENEKKFLLIKI